MQSPTNYFGAAGMRQSSRSAGLSGIPGAAGLPLRNYALIEYPLAAGYRLDRRARLIARNWYSAMQLCGLDYLLPPASPRGPDFFRFVKISFTGEGGRAGDRLSKRDAPGDFSGRD